ncbi:nucleotidyl transferase AbiEii/AbiGii toxin family protein [Polaribacter sp. IC073]|uniref:nucleotidyl transferase AbiEii/AbiGii toxin family protein n=1 Tax=Polaribacter sp. IC073 TaxID=2508540 RepID=UPI0011BEBD02|nr:nucleotidyl transferase AbiEii/AbiGii toxin family protein [Polaribacter sp. IC073]TXD49221.1 nucleotidyl transferase AbiEii/AbiGii toxin family protein [Polaribacter sp. IC073]
MSAVSSVLLQTIKELQSLPSLSQFALAGGTNLAFRFNHRESQDIDLFCSEIVGIKHFEAIEKEVLNFYGKTNISGLEYPFDKESEQHTYLRFWVTKPCGAMIKVEIIQNMKMMDAMEIVDEVRLVTTKDIGLFKLISGSSRAAKKDIYDLEFITQKIPIIELFESLKIKKETFYKKEHQNIFDLDGEECPTKNPYLLLKFDKNPKQNRQIPIHSNDNILIVEGGQTWIVTRTSWRMKLRRLYTTLGIEYPS